jgi:hypothetical protein
MIMVMLVSKVKWVNVDMDVTKHIRIDLEMVMCRIDLYLLHSIDGRVFHD